MKMPNNTMTASTRSIRTNVTEVLLSGGTYRSLEQQQLSPAEEKFETIRRVSGFILAPLGFLFMLWVPNDMEPTQQKVAAVLIGVILLWLCESLPIPVTALLGVGSMVLIGTAPAAEVLAPFGSTTIFTFIGAFILAQARCCAKTRLLRAGFARCRQFHRAHHLGLWRYYLCAVGICLQHRHSCHAASDRAGHSDRHRAAHAG